MYLTSDVMNRRSRAAMVFFKRKAGEKVKDAARK
jgi:hypothetical protein